MNWTNPTDASRINRALYKFGGVPTSAYDTSGSMVSPPPRNLIMTTQGGVTAYVWLIDNAGNANHANRASIVLNYDGTRPTGCLAFSPDTSAVPIFELNFSRGSDTGGSGLSTLYDIWLKIDMGTWNIVFNDLPDTSIYYTGSHGHIYYFEALNIDNAGNIETRLGGAECATRVDTTHQEQSFEPGDANGSGDVNGLDVTYLINYLKGIGNPPDPLLGGDANGSCAVNGIDVSYLVNYLKGVGPAPVRGDCTR